MQTESKQPHTSSLRGRQILERRKEIEQELVDMLKELFDSSLSKSMASEKKSKDA